MKYYERSVLLALLLVLDFAASALGQADSTGCSHTEVEALESFKREVDSPTFLSSWSQNSTSSCCQWTGINCSSADSVYHESGTDYRIQEIRLSGLKLKGNLGGSLAKLRGLKRLDLSNNILSGSISGANLSSLPRLEWLDLSINDLSGSIQSSFLHAVYLNFSSNAFVGMLPVDLGGKPLEILDLSNNAFSGEIPEQLCSSIPQIRTLNFSGNRISGGIPQSITRCRMIQALEAEDNELTGRIPPFLVQLRSLRIVKLSFNRFNGSIPVIQLASLRDLTELWLNKNSLRGSINLNLLNGSWGSLKVFSARENRLAGEVSMRCSSSSQIMYLDLSYNALTGSIPVSLSNCSRFQTLALTGNFLEGEIPPQLGNLKNLTTLMLSKNNLVGRIPVESLQACSSLQALVLSKNYFSGSLDPPAQDGQQINGFRNLQLLAVGNSNITGSIPGWIRNCSKLQVLDMSWNRLTGVVPAWMGEFRHLFYLDLSNNSLGGNFPAQLSYLKSLRGEENSSSLADLKSILFVKHRNNMTRLQYNQVSALPPSILLSSNQIGGSIPGEFGALKRLVCLDLSNNRLVGEIPSSFGNLSSLESLDLSLNSFGGVIPTTLLDLYSLARLNLSYNQLHGLIPTGFQFLTFTPAAYIGNPGLCGYPLPSCQRNATAAAESVNTTNVERGPSKYARGRNLAIGISLSLGFGVTGISIGVWIWILSLRRAVHHRDDEDESDSQFDRLQMSEMMKRTVDVFHRRELLQSLIKQQRPLTNADLVKATNNFDQSNIVGCGGFGLVFVASLPDGTKVAIKRLTGDCLQMEREFEAEVQALAMADHPNLVTLQGYSSYGNQRLLIYSYMENGSLDYWLHETPDGAERLDWSTRLDIARGAARGLAYLHLACEPHIVHRDIKSSNILLDGDFVAHVADFGLARLMLPTATHVSTEMAGTLGYIPPEYAQSWMATPKGDVYSFGVVLLELLARRRPVDVCRTNGVYDLVAWIREMKAAGKGFEIFDPWLKGNGNDAEMEQMLEVACLCINPKPQKRPGIQEVVKWLEEIGKTEA